MTFLQHDRYIRKKNCMRLRENPHANLTCESTMARVEARITRTITRFLGVDAKDNSRETILSISRRRARDPGAFGAL